MSTITLECGHCGRETDHDLDRVLRGLTLADVQEYLETGEQEPRHSCKACGYIMPESHMSHAVMDGWYCGNQSMEDWEACQNRKKQMEATRKLATEQWI